MEMVDPGDVIVNFFSYFIMGCASSRHTKQENKKEMRNKTISEPAIDFESFIVHNLRNIVLVGFDLNECISGHAIILG